VWLREYIQKRSSNLKNEKKSKGKGRKNKKGKEKEKEKVEKNIKNKK